MYLSTSYSLYFHILPNVEPTELSQRKEKSYPWRNAGGGEGGRALKSFERLSYQRSFEMVKKFQSTTNQA